MKSADVAELVGDLASQQWGLFTSAQAGALGVLSPDLLRAEKTGLLNRIRHGVYAIAGTPLSSEIELKAEWLATCPDAMAADRLRRESAANRVVVSHTTAADLWGIGDLWADGYHFTVQKRRRSRQADVHFHRAHLADSDWLIHPDVGLPVTSVARTIADLADAGHEAEHLMELLSDASSKYDLGISDVFGALHAKEAAFGLESGDKEGVYRLLSEHLGSSEFDSKVAKAVEQRLQPFRESMSGIAQAIGTDAMTSQELKDAVAAAAKALNSSLPSLDSEDD